MRAATFRLLLALCLLASTAQGVLARTHVHARAAESLAAGALVAVDAAGRGDPPCILCDIAGHTPAIAPPVAQRATGLVPGLPDSPVAAASALSPRQVSHHWRGRAPPIA